uniref:Uncharacterized protein n=1 Tax=Moniliophthora roreri TaxID=221103 RepID=A0A0W0FBM7_MONRR
METQWVICLSEIDYVYVHITTYLIQMIKEIVLIKNSYKSNEDEMEQDQDQIEIDRTPPQTDDEVVNYVQILSQEGGVRYLDYIMASALSIDNKKWIAACHDELKSLRERNVYKLVDLPQG